MLLADHHLVDPPTLDTRRNDFMCQVGYTVCKQWQEGMWRDILPHSERPHSGMRASYVFGPNLNDIARREFAEGWDKRIEETRERRRPVQAARDREEKRNLLALLLGCALFWGVVFRLIF
ncbi:hypothetical protein [Nitrosococcus wardiae]|uniref:Uncharacterized protein n=1 Tax=Nitrosococcus wardiae TaxID=1814290 RepID=A0A4P7C1F3_9GAMM|nr:hypothetical protein [Nitrosococcus wardiae]QBQ56201.1 hypothetical protein E3U44_18100 [Nitrosococcus wardiae]